MGELIRKKMEERDMSKAEFAQAINRHRTSVYKIFNRSHIDMELLVTISKVLNFDFYEIYNNTTSIARLTYALCLVVEIDKERLQEIEIEEELVQTIRKNLKQQDIKLTAIKMCGFTH